MWRYMYTIFTICTVHSTCYSLRCTFSGTLCTASFLLHFLKLPLSKDMLAIFFLENCSYLIFVISFTQAGFSNTKFSPKNTRKMIVVFRVQSGKFYTWQNYFTRAQISAMRWLMLNYRRLITESDLDGSR